MTDEETIARLVKDGLVAKEIKDNGKIEGVDISKIWLDEALDLENKADFARAMELIK